MELLNTLYNLMGLVFVLGTIISMGLSLTIAQITGPLRNARFVIMALLANFVVPRIAAFLLSRIFALNEPLAVGLLLVSLAPGAPGLPKMAEFAKVDTAAATGLMVLLVVVTIIILPIALPLLLTGISVTFWDIASGLIILILIPLTVSLFVRARYAEAAAKTRPFFAQASNHSLLILMVLMVVLNFNNLIQRVQNILMTPKTEWPVIAGEAETTGSLYTKYILIVSALGPVAMFLKSTLIGTTVPFVGTFRMGVGAGLSMAVASYVLGLISVFLFGLIINALAPTFSSQKDSVQALKSAAYAMTAGWVGGLAQIIPWIGWLIGLALGVYGIYLLYLGLPHTMKTPAEKATGYTRP